VYFSGYLTLQEQEAFELDEDTRSIERDKAFQLRSGGCSDLKSVSGCARAYTLSRQTLCDDGRCPTSCNVHTYMTSYFFDLSFTETLLESFLKTQSSASILTIWTEYSSHGALDQFLKEYFLKHPYATKRIQGKTNKKFSFSRGHVSASDLVRFHVLNEYGGIYIDGDVLLSSNLNPLCNSSFTYWWSNSGFPNTAVMGSAPGGAFVKKVIARLRLKGQEFDSAAYHPFRLYSLFSPTEINQVVTTLHPLLFDPLWLLADGFDYSTEYSMPMEYPIKGLFYRPLLLRYFLGVQVVFDSFFTNPVKFEYSDDLNPMLQAFPSSFAYHTHSLEAFTKLEIDSNSLFNLFQRWLKAKPMPTEN